MSRSQAVVPTDTAESLSTQDGTVAQDSNSAHDTVEANLGSRPEPIPDHGGGPNASEPIASPSHIHPSPAHQHSPHPPPPPRRTADAVEKDADGDAVGAVDTSMTPLELTTHDTAGHDLGSASPTLTTTSPPKKPMLPAPLLINSRPPVKVTSYIPPSRPQPQRQAQAPAQTPTTKGQPASEAAVLSPRSGSMFRLTTPAHRRRNMANTNALTNYEADLTSRDRAKEKEAVRAFLDEKISDEWSWKWPRPSNSPRPEFVDHMATTGRKAIRWKERDEWLSNTNDTDDEPAMPTAESPDSASPVGSFKFESPDDVGDAVKRKELEKKRRRQHKLKEELAYNEGLRCFTARRDVWTGGRHANRKITRTSSRTLSSVVASFDAENPPEDALDDEYDNDSSDDEPDIEIPVAPPLIPPTNGMRAGITPAAYNVIYDKVVLQSISPSCPVNLQDIVSACVQGWKRDGEWPPKGTPAEPMAAAARKKKARKLSVASIFGLSKIGKEIAEDEKGGGGGGGGGGAAEGEGGLRRGIQKMLGLRRDSTTPNTPTTPTTAMNGNGYGNANGNGNGNSNANGNGNGHLVKGKDGDVGIAAA